MNSQNNLKKTSNLYRELIAFFVIACAISWPTMLLWNVSTNTSGVDPRVVQDAFTRVSFIYAFGPFLSAIIVTFISLGYSGLKRLFKIILKWRIKFIWYLLALVIPPITQWLGLGLYYFWTDTSLKMPSLISVVQLWLIATPIASIFIITEEIGWRRFALPRLQSLNNALIASLVLGGFWSFWHFPLGIAVELGFGEPALNIIFTMIIITIWTMLFSILMTWIFNSSNGSLLPMLLMHGSNSVSYFMVLESLGSNGTVDLTFRISNIIVIFLLTSILIIKYGPVSLSKSVKVIHNNSQ